MGLIGSQVGTLMLDDLRGVQVIITAGGLSVLYRTIENGNKSISYKMDDYLGLAMFKDIYDNRQGNLVAGIQLCDVKGFPLEGQHYPVNEFTWSGNISYGGGEAISFL